MASLKRSSKADRLARVDVLINHGFDLSTIDGTYIRIRCSQCAAAAINGTAAHEHGCPNQTHECQECGTPIYKRYRLCDDCAND